MTISLRPIFKLDFGILFEHRYSKTINHEFVREFTSLKMGIIWTVNVIEYSFENPLGALFIFQYVQRPCLFTQNVCAVTKTMSTVIISHCKRVHPPPSFSLDSFGVGGINTELAYKLSPTWSRQCYVCDVKNWKSPKIQTCIDFVSPPFVYSS